MMYQVRNLQKLHNVYFTVQVDPSVKLREKKRKKSETRTGTYCCVSTVVSSSLSSFYVVIISLIHIYFYVFVSLVFDRVMSSLFGVYHSFHMTYIVILLYR